MMYPFSFVFNASAARWRPFESRDRGKGEPSPQRVRPITLSDHFSRQEPRSLQAAMPVSALCYNACSSKLGCEGAF